MTSMLQQPPNARLYSCIAPGWSDRRRIKIQIQDYIHVLRIPIAFLEGSRNNTLAFVQELVQHCVQEPGVLSWLDQPAVPVDLSAAPLPGQEFAFNPIQSDMLFTWAMGPDGRYRGMPQPPDDAFDDARPLSASQVSTAQSNLRFEVAIREGGKTLFTNEPFTVGQAAHLAPEHRHDVYAFALGEDFNGSTYESSHAVLLDPKMHTAYDHFKCSFYVKDDDIILHVFNSRETTLGPHHGKIVSKERFHVDPDVPSLEYPDTRLMKWHYKQCVLMRIRGFWADGQ